MNKIVILLLLFSIVACNQEEEIEPDPTQEETQNEVLNNEEHTLNNARTTFAFWWPYMNIGYGGGFWVVSSNVQGPYEDVASFYVYFDNFCCTDGYANYLKLQASVFSPRGIEIRSKWDSGSWSNWSKSKSFPYTTLSKEFYGSYTNHTLYVEIRIETAPSPNYTIGVNSVALAAAPFQIVGRGDDVTAILEGNPSYTLTINENTDCCNTSIARIYLDGIQHNVSSNSTFNVPKGTSVQYELNGYNWRSRTANIIGPGGSASKTGVGNITTTPRKSFTMSSNSTISHSYY